MFKAINSKIYMVPAEIVEQGYNKATDTWLTYFHSDELNATISLEGKIGDIGETMLVPEPDWGDKFFVVNEG